MLVWCESGRCSNKRGDTMTPGGETARFELCGDKDVDFDMGTCMCIHGRGLTMASVEMFEVS